MSDYYSHRDPRRAGADQRFDYDQGSGSGWVWGLIVLAIFAVIIAISAFSSEPIAIDADDVAAQTAASDTSGATAGTGN